MSGHADFLEGHAAAVCGPVASSPRQQAICAGLRLCGQLRSDAGQDVRAQAEGLQHDWIRHRAGGLSTSPSGDGTPVESTVQKNTAKTYCPQMVCVLHCTCTNG